MTHHQVPFASCTNPSRQTVVRDSRPMEVVQPSSAPIEDDEEIDDEVFCKEPSVEGKSHRLGSIERGRARRLIEGADMASMSRSQTIDAAARKEVSNTPT